MSSRLHTKRRLKRIAYSAPTVILLAVIAVLVVYWTTSAYLQMAETREHVTEARATKQKLTERKETLAARIESLQTPRGKVAEIRQKYSATRDDERMVVILDRPRATTTKPSEERSIWGDMWHAVTSLF